MLLLLQIKDSESIVVELKVIVEVVIRVVHSARWPEAVTVGVIYRFVSDSWRDCGLPVTQSGGRKDISGSLTLERELERRG